MNADRIIMRPALWVRLIYVSGVAFWMTLIIIGYMANAVSDSSMWVILIAILVMFLVPTLEANLMWFACDEEGIEEHNPFRKAVFIRWEEISAINRIPMHNGLKAWRIESTGSNIDVEEKITSFSELKNHIMRKVPMDKWVNTGFGQDNV